MPQDGTALYLVFGWQGLVNLGDISINKQQVRQIALQFVCDNSLDKCSIEAIRLLNQNESNGPMKEGRRKWAVQFRFEINEDEGVFANSAIVIIDDETGEPTFLESL